MSREIDVQVAEKVMGWTKYVSADHTQSHVKVLREMGIIYGWRIGKKDIGLDVPHFSTDIAAAWQVVEKMSKRGFWCQIRNEFEAHGGPDCWAGFTPHSTTGWNGAPDHWTQADTAPMAICLAALKAVEV